MSLVSRLNRWKRPEISSDTFSAVTSCTPLAKPRVARQNQQNVKVDETLVCMRWRTAEAVGVSARPASTLEPFVCTGVLTAQFLDSGQTCQGRLPLPERAERSRSQPSARR